jgi:hypothetical protein
MTRLERTLEIQLAAEEDHPDHLQCPCDAEHHVDPMCCAAGMCARDKLEDRWSHL